MGIPDPTAGQNADVELIYEAVMEEVRHCVWASTGGEAHGTHQEVERLAGAQAVAEYLTRGGLHAVLWRVTADPRLGEWKKHLDQWAAS